MINNYQNEDLNKFKRDFKQIIADNILRVKDEPKIEQRETITIKKDYRQVWEYLTDLEIFQSLSNFQIKKINADNVNCESKQSSSLLEGMELIALVEEKCFVSLKVNKLIIDREKFILSLYLSNLYESNKNSKIIVPSQKIIFEISHCENNLCFVLLKHIFLTKKIKKNFINQLSTEKINLLKRLNNIVTKK